ncbi:hypothetical protein [uncultured Nocardioides sp.]|uniref:hypothetical protein n=1 Tax=uncultured Nocardioides sp. TaxID=198441 RepID=UPI00261DC621|nr:hypothetical protein [uncultured Nocardioides sp.]
MTYNFKVPVLSASRWAEAETRSTHSADLDWPRVGIYCEDQHALWLLGSFVVSHEVAADRGHNYWAWERRYLTGDGYLIRLQRQDGGEGVQQLAANQPTNPRGEQAALAAAQEALERGDFAAAEKLMSGLGASEADSRLRMPLACGMCGGPRVFREDRVQSVAQRFWDFGIREIDFKSFAARIDRQS